MSDENSVLGTEADAEAEAPEVAEVETVETAPEPEAPVEQPGALEVVDPAPVEDNADAAAEVVEKEDETTPLDNVNKQFYAPSDIEAGQAKVGELMELGLSSVMKWNFDPEQDELPDTHGILIAPIAQRVNNETQNIGILIAAVPTVDAVAASGEAGQAYIQNAVESMLFAKIGNAVRPRDGIDSEAEVPFSIESFITKRTMGDGLSAYNKVAPDFVKALKKQGFKRITTAILRDVLSSSANAEHFFPKIAQEAWVNVIGMMKNAAAKHEDQLDGAVYDNWLVERDETAGLHEVEELDLSDLGL